MSANEKLQALKAAKAAANLEAGQAFLAENGQRPEVVTLESGLQYEILKQGDGSKPGPTSRVTCHYHGTMPDGQVFDSSVQRGQPATFPLNRVIRGWTEALQLMPTGSKWRLYLPPHLAYGEEQVSAVIGPNSTLVFDVELLRVD
jgi:FKBP-type peptidyl-prolyl cis-trans isomerase FklB